MSSALLAFAPKVLEVLMRGAEKALPPMTGWFAERRRRRQLERIVLGYLAAAPAWPGQRCVRIHPSFPQVNGESYGLSSSGMLIIRLDVEWFAPFPAEAFDLKGRLNVFLPSHTAAFEINSNLSLPKDTEAISAGDVMVAELRLLSRQRVALPVGCIHPDMRHMIHAEMEATCSMLGPWRPDAKGLHTTKSELWVPFV